MNTQLMNVNGGVIAFDDSGSGPAVICVPGMGDLRGEYRFLAPELLRAGYRVITMDVRGHGETSTNWDDFSVAGVGTDILALIRHLNCAPAIIAGSSMAAGAAIWAAAEAPELVNGLLLLGPAVHGDVTWPFKLLFGAMFSRPWGAAAWRSYYTTLFPTRKPADFLDYASGLEKNLREPGRLEALQKMISASKKSSEERLSRVQAPSLSLMGTRDPDFKDPRAEVEWVARQLKGEYHIIDGAGHYPHSEMPEISAPLILDFLKSVQPEVRGAAPVRG
jgi:pimeloyl-ACP methyl ester carboxylesterase